ncbi:hypothetical protein [Massilibacteroides sp.]|uniref:hypothetical protein n=1 Tax=Massilibacteroides sp. TaxID=2034766 RepID=UPI0026345F1A|nr:hypothetical protein [Massilibacteroides sp.]MDD4514857.1 hypothetical protein [Massilibacteroides sp.]
MKNSVILILLLIGGVATVNAQSFDRSKLELGGSVGMQFGDYTVVNIAPQLGYRVSEYFTAGVGASYTYYKDEYYNGTKAYDYKSSYFGMNVFGRFYPIQYLVLSVQPEASRMWRSYDAEGGKLKENKFVASVLVGGGLRLGPVTAMIQYDVVQDKNSPYSNKIFYSIGYTFGF